MMLPSTQMYKNIVLSAWKERWSEQKWTTTMRKLLQNGSSGDMLQVADALFTQAFMGSTPNTVLLSYFNYGLKSGTLSYAAIFTAVSKHEDMHNVTNMDYTLDFLMKYIKKLNKGQILEDSMALCKALLVILQWVLRNIEQYLHGIRDVSNADAEKIIRNNCTTLHALTTYRRTASLLTVARFEESSVWSHIETDLAVIKGAAVGHTTQNDVTVSCNGVSQLARCHSKTSAVYLMTKALGNESHHSMLINTVILLEVEWNKMTDPDTLMQQLLLVAQLCDLNVRELCSDLIRACMMGFVGNIDTKMKHKWSSVLFLDVPQHLVRLKSALPSGNGGEISSIPMESDYESAVGAAFEELLQYDSLLDMLDQITNNCDCFSWLVTQCVSFNILREEDAQKLKQKRSDMHKVLSQHPTHAVDPSKLVKYEATTQGLLSVLGTTDYVPKQEDLLTTLGQMSSNFGFILASGPATHNVENFAQKLMRLNEVVKSSAAEGVKNAQIRCMLFDFTFFFVCDIAEQYGKNVVLGSIGDMEKAKNFMAQWISTYWPDDRCETLGNNGSHPKLEIDDARVKVFIEMLQTKRAQEQSPSLKKWHDICANMSRAFMEMIKAWNYKLVTKSDVIGACDIVCGTFSLAFRLCCVIDLAKFACTASNAFRAELKEIFDKLLTCPASQAPGGQELHIEKRFTMFKNTAEFLLSDSNPNLFSESESDLQVNEPGRYPADIFSDVLNECRQVGWIDSGMLKKLTGLMKRSGAQWFCHQLVLHLLSQTRKDVVERTAMVMGGLLLIDIESLTICLLRHEIPNYLTDEADHMLLSAPAGSTLAQLSIGCLAIVLHNISLKQKGCLPQKSEKEKLCHQRLLPAATQKAQTQDNGGPSKLRRLFSVTAEHDLASGAFSSILGDPDGNASQSRASRVTEPALRALSYTLDMMHTALAQRQPGPHVDFSVYFVYLASRCGELVSQAVLQLMPLSMVSELAALITAKDGTFKIEKYEKDFDSFNFTLCISDLGHTLSRKIAAKAICEMILQ